ncbi:MAG: DUF3137 domain-containing protein [Caulobacteraceae bacterium]
MSEDIPTLDLAQLQALYTAQIKPRLVEQEKLRRRATGGFWGRIWLGAVPVLAVLIIVEGFVLPGTGIGLGCALIGGFCVYRWAVGPLDKVTREAKAGVLSSIAGAIGVSYQLDGFSAPSLSRCVRLGLISQYDKGDTEDLFRGQRASSDISVYDARLTAETTNSKGERRDVVVFQGTVIAIAFPKAFLGTTIVRRDAGIFNKGRETRDLKRVGLGDSHFEKIFEVYGTDQVEARYLVHPVFMEKLLALETSLKANKVRCAFEGGELLIVLDGKGRFEFGSQFSNFVRPAQVQKMAQDVMLVTSVIDTVLAGPPRAYAEAPVATPA